MINHSSVVEQTYEEDASYIYSEDSYLDHIRAILPTLKAEISLYEFTKQAWPQVEGNRQFVDNWHIQAICEHLEAVVSGQIRNLLINVPPRTGKSTLVSVMLPAWCWIRHPEKQFFCSSHSNTISLRDSLKCRRLIESSWYQDRWGTRFSILKDQNTAHKFENDHHGYRQSTSVGSKVIGSGGDILICDDPNDANESESDLIRNGTNDWWSQAWSTRLNDPKTSSQIVGQQRTHQMEVSGYILAGEDIKNWTIFVVPMEFEKKRICKTIINNKIWIDPRKEEGELLWPARIDEKALKTIKSNLRSQYRIAGQLQQRPAPDEGGIIKKSWFAWWKKEKPPIMQQIIQSWDTALEAGDKDSYSACTTWGLFQDDNRVMNIILLGMWRGRVEYPELRDMAKRLYNDYRDDGSVEIKPDGNHVPHIVLVEAKASGVPIVQDLTRAGIMAIRFDPTRFGDKIQRVRLCTPIIQSGRVWLPASPPGFVSLRRFAENVVELCSLFPNSEARDVVDTMSQVLLRLIYGGYLTHPGDSDVRSQGNTTLGHGLYGTTDN